ncbi:MAG: phosphatase PAP2 family protein [Thermoflexus sp.]|jgi:undecaprenyl-diphosphatase|nr:phosphatase PAP2 family protein [Thermoflexus sp.]MDT7885019.1 phosphatase PAP2 family protein [Thermoflexus sp.]MDT7948940.1 phosphatase PAP2 family protein [Thermoflexus sp.]
MRSYMAWYLVAGYLGASWVAALGVLLLRWGRGRASWELQGVGVLLLLASGIGFFAGVPEIWTPGPAGTELAAMSGLAMLGAWGVLRALQALTGSRPASGVAISDPHPSRGEGPEPGAEGMRNAGLRPLLWGGLLALLLILWRWDVPLFFALNAYAGRVPWLDGLARLLINDYAVPTALAMLAWWMWWSGDPVQQAAVLRAVLAVPLSGALLEAMNAVYFRPRPFTDHEVHLLFYHPSDSSFPSNAATVAWAIAVSLKTGNRRVGWVAMGLAAGISLARVYGGVHYPLDVVAGALLGAGLSGALFRSRMFRAASLRLARRIGGRFRL